ncbi:UNVERIFIED_ORG: branched-chain amino acid transport system substrate-binding protein [Nocardia globerula]|uniref:Branched-chain amino acid transport system substrate-binding protein n=1 Tax=Nocardia globerula TaxID=1818 RepID=A0A652YSI1_NOCGL|nr:ABC transporter substrate-binding protein [Rhodococcus globerulus]NMD61414.1 ABC transporter substrate-binding protein [Nocardia globerula]PVX67036.1 branched-chain amino acid transport system substrate-binding protein [Rhodococcus globerulus]
MQKLRTGRRLLAVTVLSATLTAGMVACSSSDDSGSSAAKPSANETVLGTPNKATGSPVTIGFISEGKSPSIDTTDEIRGAKAAAAYANDYLGGIGGHPIEVKACEALAQPAVATDCSNQMVQAGAAAVVGPSPGELDNLIDVLSPASIPLVIHSGSTPKGLSSPGVFSLSNGTAYFAISAVSAKDQGLKNTLGIAIGVPGAEGPTKQIGGLLWGNAGLKFNVTGIPPGTADMTPQIASAGADADNFFVIGNDSFCTSAFKAIKTTKPDAPIFAIDRCITIGGGSSIPNGYEGINVATSQNLSPDAPDSQLYSAILAKYGDGAKFGQISSVGYAPMLGMIKALNAAKISDPTKETVMAAMKSAPPTEYPLTNGIMFQCNGKQIPISPNICSSDGIVAKANKNGELTDFQQVKIDPSLYAAPTP